MTFTPGAQIVSKVKTTFRENSSGYTLLEISLTLAISSIIFLAVAPVFGGFIRERQFRNAANLILNCAAETRREAKQNGKTIVLHFSSDGLRVEKTKHVSLPNNMNLFLKRNINKWELAQGQSWKFFPNGLSEPISLRLELGSSWLEMDMDPLTAMVVEERCSF